MKKYTTCLLIALICCTISFAQTIIVTDQKKTIEWANDIRFDVAAGEITLSNIKITCQTLTIAANVKKIKIEGNVEIKCQKLLFEADPNPISLFKSGTNDAYLSVVYETTFTHNNRRLQTGDGEVQVMFKKK